MHDDSRATPRRILVADDDVDTRESMAMLFSLEGHSVYTASDGQQTMQRIQELKPEVALIDISMPGLDGYEVARRIRAQPWGRDLTLVALTGWDRESDRALAREVGFDVRMVKPVDLDKLMDLIVHLPKPGGTKGPGNSSPRHR